MTRRHRLEATMVQSLWWITWSLRQVAAHRLQHQLQPPTPTATPTSTATPTVYAYSNAMHGEMHADATAAPHPGIAPDISNDSRPHPTQFPTCVAYESPCECRDAHGKARLAVKNDPSTPPTDASAIQPVQALRHFRFARARRTFDGTMLNFKMRLAIGDKPEIVLLKYRPNRTGRD